MLFNCFKCLSNWKKKRKHCVKWKCNLWLRIGVGLTRGGRGTGLGRGPRWWRCCTGRICCGRRRWWICRISTNLTSLLQHLVYGIHACPKARNGKHTSISLRERWLFSIFNHIFRFLVLSQGELTPPESSFGFIIFQ